MHKTLFRNICKHREKFTPLKPIGTINYNELAFENLEIIPPKEIISQAKKAAQRIIQEQKQLIKAEKEKMKLEVEEYSAKLAVKLASRLISRFMNKTRQEQAIKKTLLQLDKISPEKND